jgi:site-specific DNA recombinase
MTASNDAVIDARYSGDRQRETSIDDQVRNCTRYAEREGLVIRRVYSDKAMSGAVTNRPGYQEMLANAGTKQFAALLVDDLSRLSRDDYEMKGVLRKFAWQALRVMFLDDLRERTHRGMTGQALRGFNCGGRTYGYRNHPIEDPNRLDAHNRPAVVAVSYELDASQAETVRHIHQWYADGYSYTWIASELNRQGVPSSRGRTWAASAIKVVLENEMYEGRITWNRRAWAKHPETGKRTYRRRPREEWIVTEKPELRIVPESVTKAVRQRQGRNKSNYPKGVKASSAQRYLLSGMMVCAECQGSFVIVGRNRYGCASHKTRGNTVCTNGSTVPRAVAEDRLLESIRAQLLGPASVKQFTRTASQLIQSHNARDNTVQLEERLQAAERVRDNILAAIKQGIVTLGTKAALESAEADIAELLEQVRQSEQRVTPVELPDAAHRYREAVANLRDRLNDRVEPAREILKSLIGNRIRIHCCSDRIQAEVPNLAGVILSNSLDLHADSRGCGGPLCRKSIFISLKP